MPSRLLNKLDSFSALVVGASQGIGLGFCRALVQDPRLGTLFCTYRTPATSQELFALRDAHPDRITCLSVDVTHESQIESAVHHIRESVDRIHLAIYSVGFLHEDKMTPEKSLRHLKAEQLLKSFHVNSIGAALIAKHLAPLFPREEESLFAAISAKVGSIDDNRLGGWYGYRASKAALNMFIRTTAIEFRRRCPQTIVVALHPGTTDTQLSKPFQKGVPAGQLFPVEHSVGLLMSVMGKLDLQDSGEFYSWNGSRLPW